MPYINSIGTATPGAPVPQKLISDFMAKAHKMTVNGEKVRLQALYRASGISTRYSVIDDYQKSGDDYSFFPNNKDLEPFPSVKSRMDLYQKHALKLAGEASSDALGDSNVAPKDITHVITVSCTGMQAPGLDIQLIEELGLSKTVNRTAINYMGCYAAMSALKVARDACMARHDARILIVCVELCSIHFQKEATEDNLLANSLFGDGAAAVVVSNVSSQDSLELRHFRSQVYPKGNDDMAWNIGNTGFEMKLSSYVPDIIKVGLKDHFEDLMEESETDVIHEYAIHPGGKRILDVFREQLKLDKDKLSSSYKILREFGNMSSATVLFVLKDLSKKLVGQPPSNILAMAFGPGLTVESAVLRSNA